MTDVLRTTIGDLPLEEVTVEIYGRTWSVLHTGAVISVDQELEFLLGEKQTQRPYGLVLWPSSLALAHELSLRDLGGKKVLELGSGTGLPGIIAAARGAHVTQTDRQTLVMHVCEMNAQRNKVITEVVRGDWLAWTDTTKYDLIIGSDVLYATAVHGALRSIFENNLAPGGTILLADPFRENSLVLLEALEAEGWTVGMDKWTIDLTPPPRRIGVFSLSRPPAA